MLVDLITYALIGFIAQLVDSSIGMAFGSLSSSLLLLYGMPPQYLSSTVHMTEIFGGGASVFSHWRLKNIDFKLIKKLLFPAIIGAALGSYLVIHIDNQTLKPWLGGYFLLIGIVIITKALFPFWIRIIKTHRELLGFFGGFLDAFGGAGWGEFISSGLLLRGQDIRTAVGSLVTVEFIISVIISIIFIGTFGINYWYAIIALAIGAIIAAPIGAVICKKAPIKTLTLLVGAVIATIGFTTLITN